MNPIITYIVSLKEETKRRSSISNQLSKLGLSYIFFDAIDARNLPKKDLDLLHDKSSAIKDSGRTLTAGEIGCATSHIEVCKLIKDSKEHISMVIEDDAIIDQRITDFLEKIKINNNIEWDIIILGYSKLPQNEQETFYKYEPISKIAKISDVHIGKPWKNWTCGTVGYLIKNEAAAKIASLSKVSVVADNWLHFEKMFSLKIMHIRPTLISEDFKNFESSIESDRIHLLKRARPWLNNARKIRGIIRNAILSIRD